jgi:hypothetical protein
MPIIGKVEWHQLTQPEFDRIVEALLVRYHAERGERAEAIDGRGGDGGRDVDVHVGADHDILDTIYQLKFFPEGFSGGHAKSRRPQITKSFASAMKDSPARWILVLPRNVTKTERKWVNALAGKKKKVQIVTWGRTRLDVELAKFPDLLAWATRDALVDTLRIIGQEKAALTSPEDLAERMSALHSVADGRSPYWGTAVAVDAGGNVTQTLVAKTPDAHLREPIVHSFQISGEALTDDKKSALNLLADYGIGTVEIPAAALSDFQTQAPDWVPRPSGDMDLQIGRPPRLHEPVVLRTVNAAGATLRSLRGFVVEAGDGATGSGYVIEGTGGLTLTLLMNKHDVAASATVSQNIANESAQDALAAIEFIESVTASDRLQIMRGAKALVTFGTGDNPEAVAPAYERMLVEDLAVISEFARFPFDVPETLTVAQRTEIRRLRLILDGYAVVEPAFKKMTSKLDSLPPELPQYLDGLFAVEVTTTVSYDILGHSVPVEDAVIHHPRAAGERSVPNGKGQIETVFRGADGSSFWVYAPARRRKGETIQLVPLAIPGLDEPPLPGTTHAIESQTAGSGD